MKEKKLEELKFQADKIYEIDSVEHIGEILKDELAKRVALTELLNKNYYSYIQEGKKILIILIHI